MPYCARRELQLPIQLRRSSGTAFFILLASLTADILGFFRVHIGITAIFGLNIVMAYVGLWSFMIQTTPTVVCMILTMVR
jgi:hypothetical protein